MKRTYRHARQTKRAESRRIISDRQVSERYNGSSLMTLWRWTTDPRLNFPKPIKINRRNYRFVDELDEWDRQRELARDAEWARRSLPNQGRITPPHASACINAPDDSGKCDRPAASRNTEQTALKS
jgi:predicted DNA-binding transcriptional regulator AlpA